MMVNIEHYKKMEKYGKGRLSDMMGGTCIGSQCCDEGMTYDAIVMYL